MTFTQEHTHKLLQLAQCKVNECGFPEFLRELYKENSLESSQATLNLLLVVRLLLLPYISLIIASFAKLKSLSKYRFYFCISHKIPDLIQHTFGVRSNRI